MKQTLVDDPGGARSAMASQILVDQSTLSQPGGGGADYVH